MYIDEINEVLLNVSAISNDNTDDDDQDNVNELAHKTIIREELSN